VLHAEHTPTPGRSWSDSQLLPHLRTPAPDVHRPPEHTWHEGHAFPHRPQLRASVCRSAQLPLHEVWPGSHARRQLPWYPRAGS